jgi:hypothetical protein
MFLGRKVHASEEAHDVWRLELSNDP